MSRPNTVIEPNPKRTQTLNTYTMYALSIICLVSYREHEFNDVIVCSIYIISQSREWHLPVNSFHTQIDLEPFTIDNSLVSIHPFSSTDFETSIM